MATAHPLESRWVEAGFDPIATPIRSSWPRHADDEIAAVIDVLRSGQVNALHHGRQCRAFEDAFASLCEMPHAIALANGTLALELALRALGIGPGDEVIVPARSFVATASCVVMCGATPVFADVDADTQSLTAGTIAAELSERTAAVIVVHLSGHPAPMREIVALVHEKGLKLVEDCAQAHGASLGGRAVGGFGDAAAFSFCTDKIMSTGGEGGMLLLRDEEAWLRAWAMKDHGKDRRALDAPAGGNRFRWLHESVGSNYRLTEMQAAIGVVQLGKLERWIEDRNRRAEILLEELDGVASFRLVRPPANVRHAYYKFYAFVRPEMLAPGWSRDRIIDAANARGILLQSGSCPEIYREQAFVRRGLGRVQPLPVAAELGATSLMLPVDPTLSEAECRTAGVILRSIGEQACGRHAH